MLFIALLFIQDKLRKCKYRQPLFLFTLRSSGSNKSQIYLFHEQMIKYVQFKGNNAKNFY